MSNTPQIEVASSDQNLNQRFRKPKSNFLVFLLAGILGVSLVITLFLISRGKKDDDGKDNVANRKEEPTLVPELTRTEFVAELFAGETATFELNAALRNAELGECSVEWITPESNLPQAVIEKITVSEKLTVTVPTEKLPAQNQNGASEKTVAWKLVGKVVAGKNSTGKFTLNLKVNRRNTPPVVKVRSVAPFDPILGANIEFSATDLESASDKLFYSVVVDARHEPEFRIVNAEGKSAIEFRPETYLRKNLVIKLEVKDEEGLVTESSVTFQPESQAGISRLVAQLEKETGVDISNASIERAGGAIRFHVDVDNEPLELVQYEDGGSLVTGSGVPRVPSGRSLFQKGSLVVTCSSTNQSLRDALILQLGQPVNPVPPPKPVKKLTGSASLLASAKTLLEEKKLFNRKSFGQLVFAFVEDFEREHAVVLNQKYDELKGLKEFLDNQKGLKAELFLAIDPGYDSLASVLNVLNEIRLAYPEQIVSYKNLAIAIAVCWDVPKSNYSFVGHQRRTKSILPENLTGAVENFKHFVTYQNQMQGRAQWLPWEFLVHVINHQTPDKDKYWALENYLANRTQFGKCYKEVPYDYEMLNTKSQVCKLNGKEYSLSNIRSYGGVCAMQADFAARVGKSLGVPSEYVGGQSANGENHAWVMWVEIRNVTRTGIAFSLESFGRYRGDRYYVGHLKDPKSGQRITDRQLELRLHTSGTDAYAKRQVDLLMKVFSELAKSEEMDIKEQLKFLEQAIKLCPWHEAAWIEVANLIANNEIDRKMHRQMNQILNSMFVHFAAFPDFTWTVFDRLVSFVPKEEDRNKYYVKLLNLYVAGQRPDLACEAQLKLTDYLEEQEETQVAMQGLAVTIKTFPDEGRYVPRLLDRLEKLVGNDPELIKQLVQFHVEFLPTVPQKRGNRASKYCIKMYERAIRFFDKQGATGYANLYRTKLQEIQTLAR